jgi:hypothetical protein
MNNPAPLNAQERERPVSALLPPGGKGGANFFQQKSIVTH